MILGLGRALWVFGFFQIFSNLGYALVAHVGPNKPIMYAAVAFELGSTGLGSGAFGVLLLRLTQKKFSATQFALLSSLFSISRVLAGPPAGLLADAIGWRDFFILTIFTGIPGLVMLGRFVPWGVREPEFHAAAPARGEPVGRRELAAKAALAGVTASVVGVLTMATLWGIRSYRARHGFLFVHQVGQVLNPQTLGAWTTLIGVLVMGLTVALMTAATLVARRGLAGIRTLPEA